MIIKPLIMNYGPSSMNCINITLKAYSYFLVRIIRPASLLSTCKYYQIFCIVYLNLHGLIASLEQNCLLLVFCFFSV